MGKVYDFFRKWLWDPLGHIFRVKTVSDLIGLSSAEWWRTPMSAVAAWIIGAAARVGSVPLWLTLLIVLAAFAIALFVIDKTLAIRGRTLPASENSTARAPRKSLL